jgi:hypothetical protein
VRKIVFILLSLVASFSFVSAADDKGSSEAFVVGFINKILDVDLPIEAVLTLEEIANHQPKDKECVLKYLEFGTEVGEKAQRQNSKIAENFYEELRPHLGALGLSFKAFYFLEKLMLYFEDNSVEKMNDAVSQQKFIEYAATSVKACRK